MHITLKRLISAVLAILMLAGLGITASAETSTTATPRYERYTPDERPVQKSQFSANFVSDGKTYTSGNFTYEVSVAGDAVITKYNGSEKNVVVPATLGGHPVVKLASYTFYSNQSVETITISGGIREMEQEAIIFCTALKSVSIPSTVDIGFEDRPDDDELIVVNLYGYNPVSRCENLESITVAKGNPMLVSKDGVLYSKSMKTILTYPAGKTSKSYTVPSGVRTIGFAAFQDASHLESVTLPDSVVEISYWAFDTAVNLTSVNIPSNVRVIGQYAFQNTAITEAFIPASMKVIAAPAFGTSTIRKFTAEPGGKYYTKNGSLYCHYDNGNTLVRYAAGKTDTSFTCENIVGTEWYAFERSYNLETVICCDTMQYIDYGTFNDCRKLKDFVIPDGVTRIEGSTFFSCYSLDSIVIPASVTYIGEHAFANLSDVLKTIYYKGTKAQWAAVEIAPNNFDMDNAKVVFGNVVYLDAPTVTGTHDAATGKNKLVWGAVYGAEKYQIYRATSKTGTYALMKTTTGTSYTNTTAEPGATYYYKVRAVDAAGNKGKFSQIKTLTCDLAQPVVKATNVASSGYNKLTWEPVEGATAYKVYRSTSRNGTYTLMKTVRDGATSYVNSNAVAGTTYYYYVIAVMDGCSAADSAKSEIKVSTCDLARPTVTLTAGTGKITVKWERVEKATGYKIYRATSKDGTYTLIKTVTSGSTTSFTNTSVVSGKTYYYKMVAILDGKEAATSAYSAVKSAVAK